MLTEVNRGSVIKNAIDFTLETCCNCGIPFFIPTYRYTHLKENPGTSFYCPNGHGQHYTGKNTEQELREQIEQERRDKLKELEVWQNKYLDEVNTNKKLHKQMKRVHNGVCPCCNRSFENLQNHIKTEHPELIGKPPFVFKQKSARKK